VIVGSAALATAGGHPETMATTVLAIAGFLVWEWITRTREGRPVFRTVVWTTLPAAAGFLLLAVQLVPFFLLLKGSRIAELRAVGQTPVFRGYAVAGQVLPGFLGSPLRSELDLSGAVPGSENFNMRSQGFVGFVTLVVFVSCARRLEPRFRRALVIAAVALLAAWTVPPFGWIGKLPPLSFLAPQYWIAPFVLFASVATGPALMSASERALPNAIGRLLLGAGISLVIAGLLPALPPAQRVLSEAGHSGIERLRARGFLRQQPAVYEGRFAQYLTRGRSTALRRIALPGLFWTVAGVALLRRRRSRALLVVAVAGELLSFGIGYLPAVRLDRIPRAPPAVRSVLALDPQRQWLIAAAEDVYPPNLATLHGVRDVRSYDVLESSEWIGRLRRDGFDESTRAFSSALSDDQRLGLAREGVRFFFSRTPMAGGVLVGGELPLAVGVYELPGATARPFPPNQAPTGLPFGGAISLAAAIFSIVLISRARSRPKKPSS
jgi:hypothetical protein